MKFVKSPRARHFPEVRLLFTVKKQFENAASTEPSLSAFLDGLRALGAADSGVNAALPAVYDELRQLASNYLRRERADHTLQPTALVHESYLRLLNQKTVDWSNRLEFLSIAARMMRRILADYAIARSAQKRGNGEAKLQLDQALDF